MVDNTRTYLMKRGDELGKIDTDWRDIPIDIEDMLFELSNQWKRNPESKYNTTAFNLMMENARKGGDNIQMCCMFHSERTPSFGVSTAPPYKYHCFTCGASGDLLSLVMHVLGLPNTLDGYAKAQRFIMKNVYIDTHEEIDILSIIEGGKGKKIVPESDVEKYKTNEIPYMFGRGLNKRVLDRYEVGFDKEKNCIVIPVRTDKGEVRFLKRRSVASKMFLNEESVYKKDVLYGLYYIDNASFPIEEVFMTEAEIDAMSCYMAGMPAVSMMGRILFKEQLALIKRRNFKTLNLLLDNDMWGVYATLEAIKAIEKERIPCAVNVCLFPEGHWGVDGIRDYQYKDANDLLKARKLHLVKKIPAVNFMMSLSVGAKRELENLHTKSKNDKSQGGKQNG